MGLQVGAHGVDVEVDHPQAQMVHIVALGAWRRAAHPPQAAGDVDQVDQLGAGPQLHQPDGVLPPLDHAAQHLDIEPLHPGRIAGADHHVVDAEQMHDETLAWTFR